MYERVCHGCQVRFIQDNRGRPRKWCSDPCKLAHKDLWTKRVPRDIPYHKARPCAGCGGELPAQHYQGQARKWCSGGCRSAAVRASWSPEELGAKRAAARESSRRKYAEKARAFREQNPDRRCSECSADLLSTHPLAKTCGARKCLLGRKARVFRERYATDPDQIRERVAAFRASMTAEQREAEVARAKAWKQQAGYYESKRIADQARRARKRGATVEKFSALEVFERDGWVCGICDDPIDPVLAYPNPFSVSLDHIVPLSKGGDHSRSNTRATHLTCNVARGNRAA